MDPVSLLVTQYAVRVLKWLATTGVMLLVGAVVVVPLMLAAIVAGNGGEAKANPLPCSPAPIGPTPPGSGGRINITTDKEARKNATIIIARAIHAEVNKQGALVGIMTAAQESNLHNLNSGDRDSLGLFQQRPSSGWGSHAQILNPVDSSDAFYGVASYTNNPGLMDVNGWRLMAPGDAAQAVQRSGFPAAYAKWESAARKVVKSLWATAKASPWAKGGGSPGGPSASPTDPEGRDCGGDVPSSASGKAIAAAAKAQLGLPYVWGGGDQNGPTGGGFDCSGLVLYSVYQATNGKLLLPHGARLQRTDSRLAKVPGVTPKNYQKHLEVGDIIVFNIPGSTDGAWGHVGIYVGGGNIIHAPHPGTDVQIVSLARSFTTSDWAVRRVKGIKKKQ